MTPTHLNICVYVPVDDRGLSNVGNDGNGCRCWSTP